MSWGERVNPSVDDSVGHAALSSLSPQQAPFRPLGAQAKKQALRRKLAWLDADERVVSDVLGLSAEIRGGKRPLLGIGRCLVPGHTGTATIARTRRGQFRHICDDNAAGGRLVLGPVDVYASAVAGRLIQLSAPALPRWRARALAEIGYHTLPPVRLAQLWHHSPDSARALWGGVELLLSVEEMIGDDPLRPFPFSYRFASDWCGGLPHSTTVDGRRWLVGAGFLTVHHSIPTTKPCATDYYVARRPREGDMRRLGRSEEGSASSSPHLGRVPGSVCSREDREGRGSGKDEQTEKLLQALGKLDHPHEGEDGLGTSQVIATEVEVPGLTSIGSRRLRSEPCPYPGHRASDWEGDGRRRICGVCHPPAAPSRSGPAAEPRRDATAADGIGDAAEEGSR
jgi:hypothetical protein